MTTSSSPQAKASRSWLVAGIAGALILVLGIGLAVWRISAHAANKPVDLSKLYWVFYKEDLTRINAADPALAKQLIAGPGVYAYEQSNGYPPLPAGVTPVQLFFSNADFQSAVSGKQIIPGVQWVADDPEMWPQTPQAEQQAPLTYMQQFARTASAHGLNTVLVPGRDLMLVPGATCGQQQGQTISQAYVSCGLPGAAAYSRIYVIQGAAIETDLTALTQLVQTASAAARQANPNVIVIVSLASAPNGSPVGYTALNQAARAVLPYVQGFELNSTPATDSRMISFLHALANGS